MDGGKVNASTLGFVPKFNTLTNILVRYQSSSTLKSKTLIPKDPC